MMGRTRVAVAIQVRGTTQGKAEGGRAREGAVEALGGHRHQTLTLPAEDEDLPPAAITPQRGTHGHI